MVKIMVCFLSFIVQQTYDIFCAACGFLNIFLLYMFSNCRDVEPAWASTCWSTKGGSYLGYQMRSVYMYISHLI